MDIQHYTKIRKENLGFIFLSQGKSMAENILNPPKIKVQSKVAEPQQQATWIYNFRMNPCLICLGHQGPFVQIVLGYIKSMMTAKCG